VSHNARYSTPQGPLFRCGRGAGCCETTTPQAAGIGSIRAGPAASLDRMLKLDPRCRRRNRGSLGNRLGGPSRRQRLVWLYSARRIGHELEAALSLLFLDVLENRIEIVMERCRMGIASAADLIHNGVVHERTRNTMLHRLLYYKRRDSLPTSAKLGRQRPRITRMARIIEQDVESQHPCKSVSSAVQFLPDSSDSWDSWFSLLDPAPPGWDEPGSGMRRT